jgi:threonine dehydrogenase-like Zn-dependent dehydrogenase
VKALVWYGKGDVRFEDAPEPEPAPGETLLEVELAGICGSDLHGYRGHAGPRVPPLVLGHEVVGRVDGERYTLYPLVGCGVCDRCLAGEDNLCPSWRLIGMHRDGVFAERVTVPRSSLVAVPSELEAWRAVLAEPLACCVGALAPYEIGKGTKVVVFGCGPIGLLSAFLAARAGAHVTSVDPIAGRRSNALAVGAHAVAAEVAELEQGAAELVVDAAGFETSLRASIDVVRNGCDVVVLGLGQAEAVLPTAVLVRRAIRLRGQFAYSRAEFGRAVAILAEGDLDLGWLSQAPLSAGSEAFAHLVERPAEYAKVLLSPS